MNKQSMADFKALAHTLLTDGVVVIPVLAGEELKSYNRWFWEAAKKFPEYKDAKQDTQFVMGAFGALGNISSFHNHMVRALRARLMFAAVPLFGALDAEEKKQRNLEQLFDRMCIRRKDKAPTGEAWHRDETPNLSAVEAKPVFGGWINLDLVGDQKFSCVKRTHTAQRPAGKGFGKLDKKEIKELKVSTRKESVVVPPGHWIVFFQHIVHEVLSVKPERDSIRLFCGFRLTNGQVTIPGNKVTIMNNQSLPSIPSLQVPSMYSKLNWVNHLPQLQTFSKQFKPEFITTRRRASGKKAGDYKVVVEHMDRPGGITAYGLPAANRYPDYSQMEREIMLPRRVWQIPALPTFAINNTIDAKWLEWRDNPVRTQLSMAPAAAPPPPPPPAPVHHKVPSVKQQIAAGRGGHKDAPIELDALTWFKTLFF